MSQLNLNNAVNNTLNPAVTIPPQPLDSPGASEESRHDNPDANTYLGILNSQPDAQTAALLKSYWVVGGGYTTDTNTDTILNNISGWGKDTFYDVIFNQDVMRNVCGDSYAHKIYNGDNKSPANLINLKPLNPASMSHITNKQGIIIRYEQRTGDGKIKKFQPEEIFHLTCNRIGDQIHGTSRFEVLKDTLEAYNEIDQIIRRAANNVALKDSSRNSESSQSESLESGEETKSPVRHGVLQQNNSSSTNRITSQSQSEEGENAQGSASVPNITMGGELQGSAPSPSSDKEIKPNSIQKSSDSTITQQRPKKQHRTYNNVKNDALKQQLQTLILAKGMSEKEFRQKIGLSSSYWSSISLGRWSCPEHLKIKIARELGVDSSALTELK